jgi:asparagine synthase (glutamine-hydrolysing)
VCGVVGFWELESQDPSGAAGELAEMARALAHRGPDDAGTWYDRTTGLGLGHRRLSIIDLSAEGHQPMLSASGRYALSYNGEVYNFRTVRRELEQLGVGGFRGSSDTEVILAAVEAWGLRAALDRFVGMFAFALWDRQERELSLVRDRLGVKPLYYAWTPKRLLFASELKAFRALSDFDSQIDRHALGSYLRFGYVPAPTTIYTRARKVAPATILKFTAPRSTASTRSEYWSAADVAARGVRNPFDGSESEAINAVDKLLRDSVALRLVSDVPIGAFLSGGVDSSTVAAVMQAASQRPIKTFSIGNEDPAYDESPAASGVARHLGTDHTSVTITASDALRLIPDLPKLYDEPFADPSQLPTYLVSRVAREQVTVALSGDGGDELFGGYNRHVTGPRLWRALQPAPAFVRRLFSKGLFALSPDEWDRVLTRVGGRTVNVRQAGQKIHKVARAAAALTQRDLYLAVCSHWESAEQVVLGLADGTRTDPELPPALSSFAESMMLWDLVTYLPDDIMTKVDRASMAVSLEAREPLLDHRLVELAWQLPLRMKVRGGTGKWILRQVLERYVPPALTAKSKMGFAVPLAEWLRGPLREWADSLLDERVLEADGFLDAPTVRSVWDDHLSGRRDRDTELWAVLVFQEWKRGIA